MTLVLRKLLASSTFAIAGALTIDFEPAQGQARASRSPPNRSKTNWIEDYEALDETAEEWTEDEAR